MFQNKDDPNYRPSYGKTYTERQLRIISEDLSVEEISNTELVKLMRKAETLEDNEVAEKVRRLHELKNYVETYNFTFSPSEAKDVLKALTPWEDDSEE